MKGMREGFLRNPKSLPRASWANQNEEVAEQLSFFVPYRVLKQVWYTIVYKRTSPIGLVLHFGLRRERDSNPRNLSVQRFSRPPQSTTLPSLLRRNWLARKKLALRVWLAAVAPLNSGSRSPRYIFLGWFFQIGCKSTAFFSNIQIFGENSCQYAKNIVILQRICTKFIQKCCYKY